MGLNETEKGLAPGLSLATRSGVCAIALAAMIFPFSGRLAVVPLAGFLLLCIVAPFFPAIGFYLPVISRGTSTQKAVALTFDDGPDPVSTPRILSLLEKHNKKATFFVNGQRALSHPQIVAAILSRGHTIGNHSHRHDNFIMCKSSKALRKEIEDAQHVLIKMGIKPLCFRPPVGITNPKLGKVLEQLGMVAVNFNCRAGDFGNRRIARLSQRILNKVNANDIIMLHDIEPADPEKSVLWLDELEKILIGLDAKGLVVLPLEILVGRPVMEWIEKKPDTSG